MGSNHLHGRDILAGVNMLKGVLLHPEMLQALAAAGHGARVLIADGNYPLSTRSHPQARRVYLNLRPGVVLVTQVLEAIAQVIPVEAATVMQPADGSTPPIFEEFAEILKPVRLERLRRFEFYDAASSPDLVLAVATGDQRLYGNILLTIGVVPPS